MRRVRGAGRAGLLAIALLVTGAANDFGLDDGVPGSTFNPDSGFSAYLTGRYAEARGDLGIAADRYLDALARDPDSPDLKRQAFLALVLDGRKQATALARQLTDNPFAQVVLANEAAVAGEWDAAEARFAALPRQGLTQILQPLTTAWAQQGGGRAEAALAGLSPYIQGPRFRGVFALNGALIADLAGKPGDAAQLYRLAEAEYGGLNMRLGAILASWQARRGDPAEAQRYIRETVEANPDLSIAADALAANVATPVVTRATDGLAEVYLALAASVRQQEAVGFSTLLLRLALGLRPDLTAARLLAADLNVAAGQPRAALAVLQPVKPEDPLSGMVRLRRAGLTDAVETLAIQGRQDGQDRPVPPPSAEAVKQLEQLARDYPSRSEPLAELGNLLRRHERFAEAAAAYDKAAAQLPAPGPADWPLFYQRGIALERSGRWEAAEASFQQALQLAPDQPMVLNYLAYSWTEKGMNLPEARRMLERAVELRPNDGAITDSLGWLLLRVGDTPGAVRLLEKAAEIQPEDATINAHLGDAYAATGRRREAEFQWHRALVLKPEAEEVARIEARLRDVAASPASKTSN